MARGCRRPGRKTVTRDGKRRERRRSPSAAIEVVRDAEEVFRAAILAGVLSADRARRDWAGHYLYMYHDEDGTAWFKQSLPRTPIRGDTRAYVSMTARRSAAGTRVPGRAR